MGVFEERDSTNPPENKMVESPKDEEDCQTAIRPQWVTGPSLWIIMTGLCLVCYLMLLDITIVSVAAPKITSEFNSLADIGWYSASYQLANAALQPLTGKIYANFTPKWVFCVFFFIFEVGSLICALSKSSNMLIVARAIAGMGGSGIQNGTITMIAGIAPLEKRPMLIGIAMGISQFGLVCGPLIGGALTEYTTWRWCFWINLPIGAVVAVLVVFLRIPDPNPKDPPLTAVRSLHRKLDLVGFVGFAAAVIMLLLALQYGGNEYRWDSSVVIGLFCGAGVTFLVWFSWNWHKGDSALLPRSLIGQRAVWSSCLTYALSMGSLFMASYYLPIFYQGVLGTSPLMSGVQSLPNIVPQVIVAVIAGILVTRVGYYLPFSLVGTTIFSIGAGLISTYTPTISLGHRIGYQIILGAGFGLGLQVPLIAIQNSVRPQDIPVATSMCMFGQQLSGALLISFGNTIFTNSLSNLLSEYAPSVNPASVSATGASGLDLPQSVADGVSIAYAKSVDRVYYLGAACGAAAFFVAWGMGWKNIRKKGKP